MNTYEFIEHHGILGQKWGKRNGPPYPLGQGAHSSRETESAKLTKTTLGKSSKTGGMRNAINNTKGKNKENLQKLNKKTTGKIRNESEEEIERNKKEAIRKGKPKQIQRYKEYMTSNELNDAINRARNMKAIDDMVLSESQKKTKDEIDRMVRRADWKELYENRQSMSNQQFNDAINRARNYDTAKKTVKNNTPPMHTILMIAAVVGTAAKFGENLNKMKPIFRTAADLIHNYRNAIEVGKYAKLII